MLFILVMYLRANLVNQSLNAVLFPKSQCMGLIFPFDNSTNPHVTAGRGRALLPALQGVLCSCKSCLAVFSPNTSVHTAAVVPVWII